MVAHCITKYLGIGLGPDMALVVSYGLGLAWDTDGMGKVGLLAYTLFSRALAVVTAMTAVVFLANKDRMGGGLYPSHLLRSWLFCFYLGGCSELLFCLTREREIGNLHSFMLSQLAFFISVV